LTLADKKKSVEQKLKNFFRNKLEIEMLNKKLSLAQRHKEETQKDIDESNIHLSSDIQAIDYSSERVQTSSNNSSPQERAIDKAFLKLEQRIKNLDEDIIELKYQIREKEKDISDIAFLIDLLSYEARIFVFLKYQDKKSITAIMGDLHLSEKGLYLSERSLWRLRDNILEDLAKWLFK